MVRYVGPRHIVIDDAPAPVPFWEPDRSFEGVSVVIIGGGPSHAAVDLDILAGHRFIAVNSSCRKVRPVATEDDLIFFHDNSWNENFPQLAADWPGPVVTSNRNTKARLGDAVRRLDMEALTLALRAFPDDIGASSGHTAACLAVIMGAARLVLVGFEGQAVGGRTHGHGDYQMDDHGPFRERFLPGWAGLAPVFARCGVDVVNATPHSAIQEFSFLDLRSALA